MLQTIQPQETLKSLRLRVKQLYPAYTQKILTTFKRPQLLQIVNKDCNSVAKLAWANNSCYMDSLFIALFHTQSPYLDHVMLEANAPGSPIVGDIQVLLRQKASQVLNGVKNTCSNIRKLFQKLDKQTKGIEHLNWVNDQLEPFDVFKVLIRIFQVPDILKYKYESFGVGKKETGEGKGEGKGEGEGKGDGEGNGKGKALITSEERTGPVTWVIDSDIVNTFEGAGKPLILKEYLKKFKSVTSFDEKNKWNPDPKNHPNGFTKKVVVTKVLSTPFMYVHVDRNYLGTKLYVPVVPPEKIKHISSLLPIYLSAVIVHLGSAHGGHYKCAFICKGVWYMYNDMNHSIKVKNNSKPNERIGTYADMIADDEIMKNAVDFIYM